MDHNLDSHTFTMMAREKTHNSDMRYESRKLEMKNYEKYSLKMDWK